jgi:hypothetical protein
MERAGWGVATETGEHRKDDQKPGADLHPGREAAGELAVFCTRALDSVPGLD